MNLLKIQQDLLKVIYKDGAEKIKFFVDDLYDHIFVMPNTYMGYVIPKDELRVDIAGAQMISRELINMKTIVIDGYKLTGTDEYRNGGDARKYLKHEDAPPVYVDKNLLKNFDANAELYQLGGSPLQPIAVVEDRYGDGSKVIVGMVMPCKVREPEKDHE